MAPPRLFRGDFMPFPWAKLRLNRTEGTSGLTRQNDGEESVGEAASGGGQPNPMIVTLRLDEQSSQFFDRQRRSYFPPERNFLGAHVTLFHKLPRFEEASVRGALEEMAGRQPGFTVAVEGLRFLGAGVAYRLASPDLSRLHAMLAQRFHAMLAAQDRQTLNPHVTVQNKVRPDVARALMGELQAGFSPWNAQGIGLDLWEYQGGPWGALAFFPFAA